MDRTASAAECSGAVFRKRVILDPVGVSWDTIGAGHHYREFPDRFKASSGGRWTVRWSTPTDYCLTTAPGVNMDENKPSA